MKIETDIMNIDVIFNKSLIVETSWKSHEINVFSMITPNVFL